MKKKLLTRVKSSCLLGATEVPREDRRRQARQRQLARPRLQSKQGIGGHKSGIDTEIRRKRGELRVNGVTFGSKVSLFFAIDSWS